MQRTLFFVLFLFVGPLISIGQWQGLGNSEDILIAQFGKPDSTDQYFDYFHHAFYGVEGALAAGIDSNEDVRQLIWVSDPLSDSIRDRLYLSIETAEDSLLINPFNTFGESSRFRIWLVPNFVVSLIKNDSGVSWRSLSREAYYPDIEDSVTPDSFFSVSESALILDSEAKAVVNVWKEFLELPAWNVEKYLLWARYDRLLPVYFWVPRCPDYDSTGYRAKLVNIVKDSELHAYILSTVFSASNAGGADFLPWKKSSHQLTYLVREDGNWKITSALRFITRAWKIQHVGRIRYHFPSVHVFNEKRANEANQFLDSVSAIFGIKPPAWINYYYAFKAHDVFTLLGFDVNGSQRGLFIEGSTILLCDTDEEFLHELVHASLSSLPRLSVIAEGIAEFLSNDSNYNNRILESSAEILQNSKKITYSDIWNLSTEDTAVPLIYAAGLIFFQKVFERGGMTAVVAFYKACTSEPEFEKAVKRYLNVEPENIDKYWRVELDKAYKRLRYSSRSKF